MTDSNTITVPNPSESYSAAWLTLAGDTDDVTERVRLIRQATAHMDSLLSRADQPSPDREHHLTDALALAQDVAHMIAEMPVTD